MSSKQPAFLLWECALCPSKDCDFVNKLSRNFNLNSANLSIVVSSASPKEAKENLSTIPSSVSDLSIAYQVITRFGNNALYDSIIDVVTFLKKYSKNCIFILVTTNFPVWINIFQRMPPKNLIFVSSIDPRSSLDFSFLPPSISNTILKWPSLENVSSSKGIQPIEIEEINEPSRQQKQKPAKSNTKEILNISESDDNGINDIDLLLNNEANASGHESHASPHQKNNVNEVRNENEEEEEEIEAINDIEYQDEANALDNVLSNESENENASNSMPEEESVGSPISVSSRNVKGKVNQHGLSSTGQPFNNNEKRKVDKNSIASTPPRNSAYDSANNDSDYSSISASGNAKRTTGIPTKNPLTSNKPASNAIANRISSSSKNSSMQVSTKFQPLIEAMKSIGKAMIALSDLEEQLKKKSEALNLPIENTNAYIAKASDAGIIIYDKSINYVRFKNRQMANATIEYV